MIRMIRIEVEITLFEINRTMTGMLIYSVLNTISVTEGIFCNISMSDILDTLSSYF